MGITAIEALNELPKWIVDRQKTKKQRCHDDDNNKMTYNPHTTNIHSLHEYIKTTKLGQTVLTLYTQ